MDRRQVKAFALRGVANGLTAVLARRSDAGLIRLLEALRAVSTSAYHRNQLTALIALCRQGHPAFRLVRRLFTETTPACRRALVNNLLINHTYLGWPIRNARLAQGLGAPSLVVISPTMRCNLRCTGCYAFEYDRSQELEPDLVDRIIREAKDLGIHFFVISGGEPFTRRDLLDLWARHHDCVFLVYTNGTLIDREIARRLGELGNVAPGISVEGFQAQTDARRGPGAWDRIMAAMDHLRDAGAIFGFSGTVTRHNAEIISSEELVDFLIEKGCYFGWYFTYMPIGREPDVSLMATPQQRNLVRQRTWHLRATRPIFVADFWSDGYLTGGCMAGGRLYLHITASGAVEPCVFCHFTVDNIRDKSLAEVLESDFFRAIRRRFPWTDNYLAPCAIIDQPWVLREAVAEGHARPSHPGAEAIISTLAPDLDRYATSMNELTADEARGLLSLPDLLAQWTGTAASAAGSGQPPPAG